MALPFTLKSTLRQKKKNYGNSNISFTHAKIYNLLLKKKSSKRNPKSFQVSTQPKIYHNFQKSSHKKIRPIIIIIIIT
jgi:hypothetical protein